MIPQSYITEWRNTAAWQNDAQVEQDFIISEALLKLYQNNTVTKTDFIKNVEDKMASSLFVNDMNVLLAATLECNTNIAMQLVIEKIINKI